MRSDNPPIIRLDHYLPSDFLVDRVDLDVRLHPTETRVSAVLALRPNPGGLPDAPLVLHGDELSLLGLALEGRTIAAAEFAVTPDALVIPNPPRRPFTLSIETQIDPTANTKLMGLYRSGASYCTQCEAEGFRRITYFLDRPDVLAVYTTRIEASRDDAPVLLGNGNRAGVGVVPGTNRHYAIWHDPFPKPSYLFAIVGGRLGCIRKTFTTMTGRSVEIAVYAEPGKEERATYALDALERSMRWDERTFGREYDLDVFNVVAVSDFNMGAMENKGLNIFNDRYVLASPETATDSDYANIEAIIAHEYFHNWTGNRITCRDWFQLCLKEGLTVFRDQEFSSDERSRSVHRISEVKALRARQFSEDAGPLAHPVRPTEYREINNFYTATVYEKGAEIVRMLRTLVGEADFRRGMDLYFERCDGTAAIVEDFLQAFADVTGRDLSHFAQWYQQSGTPQVAVDGLYDPSARTFRLEFSQSTAPTSGQPAKSAMVIPIALGLVAADGTTMHPSSRRVGPSGVFVLDRASDDIVFEGVSSRPVPSVFRGFSAPVRVAVTLPDEDLIALLRHDSDPFNRWEAAQTVATRLLVRAVRSGTPIGDGAQRLAGGLLAFLQADGGKDRAFTALVLQLPNDSEVAQEIRTDVDPERIHCARKELHAAIGAHLSDALLQLRETLAELGPYSPDAVSAGGRALRNQGLDLIAAARPELGGRLAGEQFETASNMTDRLAALAVLALIPGATREQALSRFADLFAHEPLVLDKWFALQAAIPERDALDRIRKLMQHRAFTLANPNRVRAVLGSFTLNNPTQFHRLDGAGYEFVADMVLQLDPANPQVAARLLTAFGTWKTMETRRRSRAEQALRRIVNAPNLSPDVTDIVQRSLG